MIEIENLTKSFKRKISKKSMKHKTILAVDDINIKIKKGEIYGLIGANGAGKTTTLKILSTLIIPDKGTVRINNYDVLNEPDEVKKIIGLLAGEFSRSLYWRISGRDNLKFFAELNNVINPDKKIDELLKLFNLEEYQNEKVMRYSTGMKHKLVLARGLLSNPQVLFLDEPLTGIDPITSYEIKKIIRNKFFDKTIIWTTHNLYEVEEMCHRVGVINEGRIILEGDPDSLKRNHQDQQIIIVYCDKPELLLSLENSKINNKYVEITTYNIQKTIEEIIAISKKDNIKIIDLNTIKPSLEKIFMRGVKNDV